MKKEKQWDMLVYEYRSAVNEFFHANPSLFLKNFAYKIQKSAKVGRYACPAFALSVIDIFTVISDCAAASDFFCIYGVLLSVVILAYIEKFVNPLSIENALRK